MFHFHLSFHKEMQEIFYNNLLLILSEFLQLTLNLTYYIIAPINSINQQDVKERKSPIWCAGGFSEDVISTILNNALIPIILSIIDYKYAWQLIQITYYKYLNTNSNLTQFQANQKVQKKMNFNVKNTQTNILIHLCFYYGYIFPICYPITLIELMIIYWIDKYQLINYGVRKDLKLEFRMFKLYIYFSIMLQICSSQIIHAVLKVSIYTRYQLYTSIFLSFLLIALFLLTSWFFKKEAKQDSTNGTLMRSLEHNSSYSKYNPLIDETLWLNEDQEVDEQQLIEGLHLHKFSRQAKFYDALKVKLLRELEKEFQQKSVSTARIQPLQVETI
ncbi:unnamed protein product (macronuclear) [Paramecium tetraurelia]|uniref:CSC1/OSCA1-like 7TM region domain-containing protein n=1 Tax=Paramecium tetraurelia TaxID=5888 RepID=A0C3S6_PARTE|nr:uncharacterized protein GSPATT00034922001 [Paramecium tetraurelia]CAK65443.1 unnamed protein product [Paramecium tetraurelia]|eukprot:XP_001432840.1 hypothetical protein (macronuclear) [Paramecium tetraurelia strain d4-2]